MHSKDGRNLSPIDRDGLGYAASTENEYNLTDSFPACTNRQSLGPARPIVPRRKGFPMQAAASARWCVLLIAFALPSYSLAQDQCAVLLQHGIFDHLSESGSSSNRSAATDELCRAYSQYQSDNASGNAGAKYGLFSGSVSLSKSQVESIGESMCHSAGSNFDANDFKERNQSVISAAAVQAWQACVTQRAAISVDTTFNDTDQGTTGLTVSFHKSGASAGTDQIKWIKTSNLDCTGGDLDALINKAVAPSPVELGSASHTLPCSRAVAGAPFQAGTRLVYADNSSVTISTTAGDITRSLPAILPPPPPSAVPKGTIVAWYSTVAPVPSGWALCDGTGGTPDLRDRFLMGTGLYPEVGKSGGTNQQTVSITIDRLDLATGGTDHPFAMRMANGNGIINHQTACAACNLVDSYTQAASKQGQFDNRPAYTEIMYIIKQ